MMDQSAVPTERLIEEIGRLRQELANVQAQFQQLSKQNLKLESELEIAQTPGNQANTGFLNQMPMPAPNDEDLHLDYEILAHQLRKAAIISQKISHIREPEKLLNNTISLIQSSFNLYHVHIYLYDDAENLLRVHIGSGIIGQQLQEKQHQISLEAEKSLVALAARRQQLILVQDVHTHPHFLANPLLPDTQAELAIPLQYGRTLLGILDIQDSQPNRFGPAEIDTFLTLAGHIAIALQNARLFTERSQIEQTLKYQANLLQNVSDAVVATDNEFRIQSWNKAAEAMYGWQSGEVLGKPMGEIVQQIYPEESRGDVIAEFLATGRWEGKTFHHKKDGTRIPILAAVTAIKNEQGIITGAVAVNRDITDQMQIEETLHQRTRTLEARNEDLAQFAYAASHDLQEPLRMITSYLQLLAQRYENELDEEAEEFIGYAIDGANRMRQLITDLLAYSRIGRNNQAFTRVSLETVLEQALYNLEITIQETKALITHEPLPTVTAEKTQMMQLFQNLLSNALKFRKQEVPRIHISARQEKEHWIIQISDNGIGIDPQLIQKIFVIFQRLHSHQEYPGTGIGLAMCKKIVQNHGGTIWVTSEPGQGSIFSFSLPIQSQLQPYSAPDAS